MSEIINELKALEVKYGITYKNVRLGDLFEIHTGSLIESCRLKPGTVKRISAMSTNNGVLGSFNTELIDKSRHFENFISVNFFGTDGGIFYHPYKASVEMKVHVLQPKYFTLTKATGLYLSTSLKPVLKGFEYGNQLSSKMLKNSNFEISLPHEPDGTLAIGFMEEFIATLERKRLATLDAYLSVKGWTTEDLGEKSEIQNQLTNLLENREIEWKDVQLGDLFEINTSPSINKGALVSARKGPYEFIGRTKQNYGVQQYIQKQNWEPNPENTFSISQIGSIHMQWRANKWYSSQNMFLLIPKVLDFSKSFNYITACVNKQFTGSGYQNYPTLKSLHVLVISLPHTPEGNLDLEFMEEFIELIEKLKIHNVANELQTRINLTESIISNPN